MVHALVTECLQDIAIALPSRLLHSSTCHAHMPCSTPGDYLPLSGHHTSHCHSKSHGSVSGSSGAGMMGALRALMAHRITCIMPPAGSSHGDMCEPEHIGSSGMNLKGLERTPWGSGFKPCVIHPLWFCFSPCGWITSCRQRAHQAPHQAHPAPQPEPPAPPSSPAVQQYTRGGTAARLARERYDGVRSVAPRNTFSPTATGKQDNLHAYLSFHLALRPCCPLLPLIWKEGGCHTVSTCTNTSRRAPTRLRASFSSSLSPASGSRASAMAVALGRDRASSMVTPSAL